MQAQDIVPAADVKPILGKAHLDDVHEPLIVATSSQRTGKRRRNVGYDDEDVKPDVSVATLDEDSDLEGLKVCQEEPTFTYFV